MSKNNTRRPANPRGKGKAKPRREATIPQPRRAGRRAAQLRFRGNTLGVNPYGSAQSMHSYIDALCHPVTAPAAGIPKFPVVPSLKFKNYEQYTFATSPTDGIGWFCAAPIAANISSGYRFGTTGSSTHADWTNGTNYLSAGFPYDAASLSASNVHMRIVHMYMRVKNITPLLGRGGQVFLVSMPDGRALNGSSLTPAQLAQFHQTGNFCYGNAEGRWSGIGYFKSQPDDYDYVGDLYPPGTAACVGVYATGAAQTYMVEIYTFVEYITDGTSILPGATQIDPHPAAEIADGHYKQAHTLAMPEPIPVNASRVIKDVSSGAKVAGTVADALRGAVGDVKQAWGAAKAFGTELGMFAGAA